MTKQDGEGPFDNAVTGAGGELHQRARDQDTVLTTNQGVPISDDQNSLTVGPRGPTLLEDFHFLEKIT
ncbi:MAG TPA: catalase, partial [Kofleriaceae bacterium]